MVTHWTARMPPHSRMVLRYQSGKWPEVQASVKFARLNGPAGNSEAMSAAPASPGRRLATAIQANGIAHSSAMAHSSSVTILRFIMNPAFERTQRHDGQREQECNADYGRRRGETGVVVLMRLLVDIVEQQRGRI